MASTNRVAELAALAGNPSRAAMLCRLMTGRAYTTNELANAAGVSQQTASGHLARLLEAQLVAVLPQGRHRYYRLYNAVVADMIEGLSDVALQNVDHKPISTGPRDPAERQARLCYDHVAGLLGVRLYEVILGGAPDREPSVRGETPSFLTHIASLYDLDEALLRELARGVKRRAFCRHCLDWSERRFQIGGALGATLAEYFFRQGWLERTPKSRALSVTRQGADEMHQRFGLSVDEKRRGAHRALA